MDFVLKGEEAKMAMQVLLSARASARGIENACTQLLPLAKENKLITNVQPAKEILETVKKQAAEISAALQVLYDRNAAEAFGS